MNTSKINMKVMFAGCLAFVCAGLTAQCEEIGETGVHGYTPKGYIEVTDPAIRANIERFRDMKLGLMMHFGIYSQVGIDESWPLVDTAVWRARQMTDMGVGDEFKRNYWNLAKTFSQEEAEYARRLAKKALADERKIEELIEWDATSDVAEESVSYKGITGGSLGDSDDGSI